ncbi:MAG: hypothetical protein Kow00123_06260 [Anaerolineales bacterium]
MRKRFLWLALIFLSVAAVACKPQGGASGACGAPPQIPYSEELAQSLDGRLQPYLQGQTGRFVLQTTAQELTSWIAYSAARWSGIPIKDAVVWFSQDRVHFSGAITRVLIVPVRVQVHARVWLRDETLQVSVEQACVGRTALPRWVKNLASRVITETILDTGPYVRLESLEVGDGYLRASGRIGR